MNEQEPDGWEYPYAARYGAAQDAADAPAAGRGLTIPWRSLWRWTARAAIASGVLLLVAILAASIPFYRAARQAWLIADMKDRGAIVYWHDAPEHVEHLPYSWQERFGNAWWSEVRVVEVHSSWLIPPSAADVQAICEGCSRFRRLERFEVDSDHFSCELIADWPHLDRVQHLTIGSSKVSDADLAILGGMQGLQRLTLARARISSEGVANLAAAPRLDQLTLEEIQWLGTSAANSSGFGTLTSLVIHQSPQVHDDAVVSLGPLPRLEEVNFNGTPIGDRGLAQLLSGGKVRSLIVHQGSLTDASLAAVAQHSAPAWLVLSGMPLTNAGLEALSGKEFPTLVLDGTRIDDEGFRPLSQVKGLDFLSLSNTRITGTGVRYLDGDHLLSHVILSGSPLTPEGIAALANLRCSDLALSGTQLDDQGLMLFAANESLTRLDVTQTLVTREGVKAFYEARKARRSPGTEETLWLTTDYPEVLESVFPEYGWYGMGP